MSAHIVVSHGGHHRPQRGVRERETTMQTIATYRTERGSTVTVTCEPWPAGGELVYLIQCAGCGRIDDRAAGGAATQAAWLHAALCIC
jgi:hypothetical protein